MLVALAGLLAAVVAGALLTRLRSDPAPLATTVGGVTITSVEVRPATRIPGLPPLNAIDGDDATYWGIRPNPGAESGLAGATFVLELDGEHTISSVGISNGTSTDLGRVAAIDWATSIDELGGEAADVVRQAIPDAAGEHREPVNITTDRLVLRIAAVHDLETPNAGIAEILLEAG